LAGCRTIDLETGNRYSIVERKKNRWKSSMENELMKQNEMTNAIAEIQVVQGSVVFGAYHDLKQQASELAEQIRTVDVNEENVKQSKKLLAEVNKRVKQLEDKRISIKKMMLEPYQDFEEQVKEIVGIVKDADAFVRSQVKELEEKERQEKEIQIHELFTKRIQHYSFREIVPFMDFAKPKSSEQISVHSGSGKRNGGFL
jgi:hypothetical protein